MGDIKQVKVDNWGTFFLQRLKHFFNRTDYCDLTLQFQDNAQLKVHRLVLNACTEYFELLERTCEMYEDCLIMPDDLQADVVVPIVNFMYTGQLEYKYDLLNKLYQTAQIMNMSVLTKLLDTHRTQPPPPKPAPTKYKQHVSYGRPSKPTPSTSQKKVYIPPRQAAHTSTQRAPNVRMQNERHVVRKAVPARPTRYELPEELDKDDLFQDSFSSISYESRPLMTHPSNEPPSKLFSNYETPKSNKYEELRKIMKRPSTSTADVAEFKRLKMGQNSIFGDTEEYAPSDDQLDDPFDFQSQQQSRQTQENSSQMFDHVVEMQGAKVTIETKSNNENSIDHAKIISEVLKKYPHLVKNNKNIKLKIVNSPKTEVKSVAKRLAAQSKRSASPASVSAIKTIKKEIDFTYETDITDTKEMGRLIALGVENVKGPWLCLICGTPGKALNFTSYHKFRNHLVDVHNERPPSNMCEYCGLKSGKRNHLLHHIYTKHGVPPPPSYNFPKCNQCSYIALTQAFLIKHKMAHTDVRSFTCNVCQMSFKSSTQLLQHIQQTGHKICPDRKANLQCIYCMKVFLRESNLYAHLKTAHKSLARHDGIIDNSDDEDNQQDIPPEPKVSVKREPVTRDDTSHTMEEEEYEPEEEEEAQYQIQESDGNIQIINKKVSKSPNQKILNQSLLNPIPSYSKQQVKKVESPKVSKNQASMRSMQDIEPSMLTDAIVNERIVVLNQNEYLYKGNSHVDENDHLAQNEEYIISDMLEDPSQDNSQTLDMPLPQSVLSPSMSSAQLGVTHHIHPKIGSNQLTKKSTVVNQPYQIVVSSEQEYKALMAGNPSIIFPDGTQSKALSVMAHSSNMTPEGIDLDPSQNSDMMIIQEDYPMNVSEALAVDNSNIVVVYSHQLNAQEMQYSEQQLVNAQGTQEQLVQTSDIVPSISAATPIMGGEIIVQQPMEQWQTNSCIQTLENAQPIVSHITMQDEPEAVHSTEQVSAPTVVDKGLTELAELQILSQTADVMTEVVISQPSDMHQIQPEDLQDTTVTNLPDRSVNPDAEQEQMVCMSQDAPEPVQPNNVGIILPQEQSVSEMIVGNQEEVPLESQDMSSSMEETPEVEVPTNDENLEGSTESESSQELPEDQTETIESTDTAVVSEQIKNLTAEWSDDESALKLPEDVVATPGNDITETGSSVPVEEIVDIRHSEVEESIENIQQEMENQLTTKPATKRIIITSDIILPSTTSLISTVTNSKPLDVQATLPTAKEPEDKSSNSKISSLLNDWEDNDSQPESIGAEVPDKCVDEETVQPEEPESVVEATVAPNDDKLKSLDKIMSDWDDDEEKEE